MLKKKRFILILILFFIVGLVAFSWNSPIIGAIKLLTTEGDIVKLSTSPKFEKYITTQSEGVENLKNMIEDNGWKYYKQEGSGYFFLKNDKQLIMTTEVWYSKFIVAKVFLPPSS